MHKKRRKFSRIEFQAILQYNILKNRSDRDQSFSSNISEGGACFIIERRVKKGDILDIELYSPVGPSPIFRKANIIWVKEEKGHTKNIFKVGVAFSRPIF